MKNTIIRKRLLLLLGAVAFFSVSNAERVVILHSNDTHSTIDPLPDGSAGILQRKAIIDSIRNVEKNVILVDAGDIVQGTLFFKYFNGEVEYPLMDMMGYDLRVLGNHEFDNGMESLRQFYKNIAGTPLSANYDFKGTELEGIFRPFAIREIAGKKIGFIGINIDPSSIIAQKNFNGQYRDVITVANELASKLKHDEGCDVVAVISHIGYEKVNDKPTDVELAQASEDIDLIIGGHSHTLIDPANPEKFPSLVPNKNGRPVRIVQTGKQGRFLGKLVMETDSMPLSSGEHIGYELIAVNDRFPEESLDTGIIEFLKPYRAAVDSVNNLVIAHSAYNLEKSKTGGLPNLTADIAFSIGKEIVDSLKNAGTDIRSLDLAVMNVGGIRHHMPRGPITEGQILSTYPFSNHLVIIEIKGKDIIEALKVAASKGGEAVSSNIRVVTDPNGLLEKVIIDGKEMDPDKEYIMATIDYVAEGNDDLVSLGRHKKIWVDDNEVSIPILKWIKDQQQLGLMISPDLGSRFVVNVNEAP